MFDLLLITDPRAPLGLVGSVRAALEGAPDGRLAVQLRAKALGAGELLACARELRAVTRAAGALLLINDRMDVAALSDADGVHLPEAGLPASAARRALGPSALIGASCHDARGLARAAEAGAPGYATLSPVFDVPGKAPALGVAGFRAILHEATLPVYALGGIRAEHLAPLRAAGARGVAVISAVFSSREPAQAVRALLTAWDAAAVKPAEH
jgi:thiamine-phosphate pyrophosphorylase